MSWAFPLTCSVVSRNTSGTAVDAYGNVLPVSSGTATVDCDIQQTRTNEPGEAGEWSVSEWMGFFPSGTSFDTGDQIVQAMMGTFEVTGRPWDANTGSDAVDHVEATLKVTD